MQNKMLIRAESKDDYANFAELLHYIKADKVTKYFLVVNNDEVEITPTMAGGIAMFFDEYNREVCKLND